MGAAEEAFMELVQMHERTWANEQYPGRPSLAELLNSPVVVMWVGEGRSPYYSGRRSTEPPTPSRYMFSAHKHIDELNTVIFDMIAADRVSSDPRRRIARVYVNKKQLKVKGLRLLIAE